MAAKRTKKTSKKVAEKAPEPVVEVVEQVDEAVPTLPVSMRLRELLADSVISHEMVAVSAGQIIRDACISYGNTPLAADIARAWAPARERCIADPKNAKDAISDLADTLADY